MQRFFLSIFTIIILLTNTAFSEENITFIDMDKVILSSKPGSSILEQLNKLNKENLTFFEKEEKILKEKEAKLISQKNIISETDFIKNLDQLKIEINDYNQNKKKILNNIGMLKVDNTNKLLKLINPILVKFSEDNSISFILQKKNLVIGKSELDITDRIIKIVNTEVKEFKIK